MPWQASDAEGKTEKASTLKLQKAWAKIANSRLEACLGDIDGKPSDAQRDACKASAIKVANAAISEMQEQEAEVPELAQIAQSVIETARAVVNDSQMLAALAEANDVSPVDMANKMLDELETELKQAGLNEAVTKKASDYLVVEDSDKPSTWHLPVKKGGKPDHRLMGAAWAALHGGYRGNKYAGPDKAKAIAKLKALYKSENMETPMSETAEMDIAELLRLALALLEGDGEETSELGEAALCESASGAAIALAESGNGADPLKLRLKLIEPGFGNAKDNHYYSRKMLERDAHIFAGAKMYATDHKQDEKSVRTEVSQILECPVGFTETGAPIALVGIFDNDFADSVRNREALNKLTDLHCSILAQGRVKPGKVDGRKVNVVEAITSAQSVDWVTKAGAGGHALNLAESNSDNDGGETVTNETAQVAEETSETEVQETETEEVTLAEQRQQEEEEIQPLAKDEVARLLSETNLPRASKERLAGAEYADGDAVEAAVVAEVAYVKKLTGSGKPTDLGASAAPDETRLTETEVQTAFDDIDRRHGLYVREVQDA